METISSETHPARGQVDDPGTLNEVFDKAKELMDANVHGITSTLKVADSQKLGVDHRR